jgi:hypothetical protein
MLSIMGLSVNKQCNNVLFRFFWSDFLKLNQINVVAGFRFPDMHCPKNRPPQFSASSMGLYEIFFNLGSYDTEQASDFFFGFEIGHENCGQN